MELSEKILKHPHLLGHYLGYNDLTDIHSEWIIKAWTSRKDYVLQAHRNSYKTSAVLVIGTIWYLLYNPEATILIVRKEYEGAASILKAIQKHYESEEMTVIYKMFGFKEDFRLKDCRKDTITLPFKKIVTKEGNIDSLGIGGAITGRHYDKIICDDIVTLKDRVSKAERDKTKSFAMELMNIKKPEGTITVTGTPWHREDVFSILPQADKYPLYSVNIKGLSESIINDIRGRTTPSLFAINYLLKHVADENKIFSDAKFWHWGIENSCIAHLDAAYSGTHYTSLSLLQMNNGKIVLKGWVWRESLVDLYQRITNLLIENNCGTIHMEDNADKGLGRESLMKYYPNVMGYHEKENKHNKIIMHLKGNWPEVYFDYKCQEEYLNQILDYEEGEEPDDAADSASCILRIKNGVKPLLDLMGVYNFDSA